MRNSRTPLLHTNPIQYNVRIALEFVEVLLVNQLLVVIEKIDQ